MYRIRIDTTLRTAEAMIFLNSYLVVISEWNMAHVE